MKERPILFNGEMVKAILEDRKTQTRRIIKTRVPILDSWKFQTSVSSTNKKWEGKHCFGNQKGVQREGIDHTEYFKCPYGYPGDRLWVKETFCELEFPIQGNVCSKNFYKADGEPKGFPVYFKAKWRPSIHMSRFDSRITLEITNVRVERLQDISEEDAFEEGVPKDAVIAGMVGNDYIPANRPLDKHWCNECQGHGVHGALGANLGMTEVDCTNCDTGVKLFRNLWESIDGSGAWEKNPWVWVIEFRRVK